MLTHEEVQVLLAAVPWGRMAGPERQAVGEHLASCMVCRNEWQFDRRLETELAPLRGRAGTFQEVVAQLRRPARTGSRRLGSVRASRVLPAARRRFPFQEAVAAALLVTAAGLAVVWYGWYTQSGETEAELEPPAPAPAPSWPDPKPALADRKHRASQPTRFDPRAEESPAGPAEQKAESGVQPPFPTPALAAQKPAEEEVPLGLAGGRVSLRPIQASAPWSERDSVRLSDGATGLDLFESDLRVVHVDLPQGKGSRDVLAVSLAGGRDPMRLTDLGKGSQAPVSIEETDALALETGCHFLLRANRHGKDVHYLVDVPVHRPGEVVELEWRRLDPEQAVKLAAEAEEARGKAPGKAVRPKEPDPPGVLGRPDHRKKRP